VLYSSDLKYIRIHTSQQHYTANVSVKRNDKFKTVCK
jgi:hypothetical protein